MNLVDKYKHLDLSNKYADLDQNKTATPTNNENPEAPGYLESLARGAEQGLTFGFGDEINAGLESLTSGKPYAQAVQESRDKFNAAESENPITSLAGNLGGAILPMGLLSKIVGGGAAALRAGATIGENASAADKILKAIQYGSQGMGGVKNLAAAGAVEGALSGAGMGAGSAENMSDIPSRMLEEAKTGAEIGGAGGAVLGAGKKILGSIANTDVGQDIKKAWQHGNEGINFLDQKQGNAAREVTGDVIDNATDTIDDVWNKLNKGKLDNLANAEAPYSMDKAKLEGIKSQLPSLEDIDAKGKLATLQKEAGNIDKQNQNVTDALSQNPLHSLVGDQPILINKVSKLQKAQSQVENSIRDAKYLTKDAQDRINHLQEVRANLVNGAESVDSNAYILSQNQELSNAIAQHPVANDEGLAKYYQEFKNLTGDARKEFISGLDEGTVESLYDFESLEKNKRFFGNMEKLSTDKGAKNKLIRSLDNEMKNIDKSFKTDVRQEASKSATNSLKSAEDDLMKSLKLHGIELNDEQLASLKSDKDYVRQLEFYHDLKSAGIKNAKEVSIQESKMNNPDMKGFSSELESDQRKAKKLADHLNNLEQEFGDLNNISPDRAKELWKRTRDIEKDLTNGKGNISSISDTAPKTAQMFGEFKKMVRDAFSGSEKTITNVSDTGELLPSAKQAVTDDFGNLVQNSNFAESNKNEQQLANVIQSLTGNRFTGAENPKEALSQTKKIFQASKDKSLIGESFDFRQALKEADAITDPEAKQRVLDALNSVKKHTDLVEGYAIGQNRMLYNPIGKSHTVATTSAVSANTKGLRNIASTIADKVPTPSDLYAPGTAEKISNISPTLGKMMERLQDSSTSEAKRRAYHNILLNNPIVRRALTTKDETAE